MDSLLQDLRFAFRMLGRRRGWAAVAVLSRAVGIGANTAIFSVANHLLLRPLPGIRSPDQVVEIGRSRDGRGFDTFSYPDFLDVRSGTSGALEAVAGYRIQPLALSRGGEGERVTGILVSPDYFRVMGVRPAAGRLFLPDEDRGPGQHPVAVVSHRFWQHRLGADPAAVGSTLHLNRQPHTVVGILPPEFGGHIVALSPEVYVPLMQGPLLRGGTERFEQRRSHWFHVVGRLRAGVGTGQADAAVKTVFDRLERAFPESHTGKSASVVPLGPVPGGGRGFVAGFMTVLMALVGVVLLVTCANVAGMFLARAATREKEVAVRLALGAGRRRLVRQLVTEALVIFLLGGGAGVALAVWGLDLLPMDRLPFPERLDFDFAVDLRVLAFATLLTLATGLVFGLVPALHATRLDLSSSIKEGDARSGRRRSGLRRAFVTAQVALSLVLLVAAGLFLRALQRAGDVETGFDAREAYATSLDLSMEGYEAEEEGIVFYDELLRRVRGTAGIGSAALAQDLPLDMSRASTEAYPDDRPSDESGRVGVDFNVVSPGYHSALRIRVLEGRAFEASDRAGSEPVALVSRAFVEEVWPGEDVVGRRIRFGGDEAPWRTVVGVVEDVKNQSITETPSPFVYVPLSQSYAPGMQLVVRSRLGHAEVAGALRRAILDADPGLSLTPVLSLERYTRLGMLPQRMAAALTSALGLVALLLSGLGVYGVVALAVSQRTREIGIRIALGAERGRVLEMVVRDGLGLALPGVLAGAVLTVGVGYLLRGFILGVSPFDPLTLTAVALALLGMVLLGSWIPARKAARIQPSDALRYD